MIISPSDGHQHTSNGTVRMPKRLVLAHHTIQEIPRWIIIPRTARQAGLAFHGRWPRRRDLMDSTTTKRA